MGAAAVAENDRYRVLSVDDSDFARRMVRVVLTKAGYDVADAASGEEAFAALGGDRPPHALVVDLELPGIGGLGLIDRVRAANPALPAVLLTNAVTPDTLLAALNRRVVALLGKPFEKEALVDALGDTLQMAQQGGLDVRSATRDWIELSFPSHLSYVRRLAQFIDRLEGEIADREREYLVYALVELLQNAVEHGNRFDPQKRVFLAWYRLPDVRVLRVRDEGAGFDPLAIPHAVGTDGNDPGEVAKVREGMGLRPGGLGIASAKRIADALVYNQAGNEVLMVRRIGRPVE